VLHSKHNNGKAQVTVDLNIGEQYLEWGWETVPGVYTDTECDAIAKLSLAYVDQVVEKTDGAQEPRKVSRAYPCDLAFRAFVHDPRLVDLVRRFIGGEPLLMMDQIFMKPPRHGSKKPYHQDNAYFKCEPADQLVTAWIALDDVNEENGCLRYIDGSHKGEILDHIPAPGHEYDRSPDPAAIDLSRESLAIVSKGSVVFHHVNTLHTSHENRSDRWRRGFATHWVTTAVTGDSNKFKTGYFHEPDYPRIS